jgi:hypothetical protein
VGDAGEFERAARELGRLRRHPGFHLLAVAIGFGVTWSWLGSELGSSIPSNWRVAADATGKHVTLTGWWLGLVGFPFHCYVWLRWVLGLGFWTHFLHRLSGMKLRLHGADPDRAGGLAFLGVLQARFGIVIFLYGVVIAVNVVHAHLVDSMPILGFQVLGMVLGYVILAPILFLMPMLTLTRRLYLTKHEAVSRYGAIARASIAGIEGVKPLRGGRRSSRASAEPVGIQDISVCYANAQSMRVLPVDTRSILELFASAGAPMVPLMLKFLPWAEARHVLELFFGGK